MHQLKYAKEEYRPGEWRVVDGDGMAAWRKKRRQNVRDGVSTYGVQTGFRDLPKLHSDDGESATVSTSPATEIQDPRATQQSVVDMYHQWINDPTITPDARKARVTLLRILVDSTGTKHFEHMTDAQVAESLHDTAGELARESAQRVYRRRGWDTPTETADTGGVLHVPGRPEYNADEWAVPNGEAPIKDRRMPWQLSQDS